jgi:hypothetical protein
MYTDCTLRPASVCTVGVRGGAVLYYYYWLVLHCMHACMQQACDVRPTAVVIKHP